MQNLINILFPVGFFGAAIVAYAFFAHIRTTALLAQATGEFSGDGYVLTNARLVTFSPLFIALSERHLYTQDFIVVSCPNTAALVTRVTVLRWTLLFSMRQFGYIGLRYPPIGGATRFVIESIERGTASLTIRGDAVTGNRSRAEAVTVFFDNSAALEQIVANLAGEDGPENVAPTASGS